MTPTYSSLHLKESNNKVQNNKKKQGWLQATRKEIKQLISSGTIDKNAKKSLNAPVIGITESNKIKLNKDGNIDKLKVQLCVRGDIQKRLTPNMEDTHSPSAAFRMLKLFLGLASSKKSKVYQGDVIGAFLQAKMHSEVYVTYNKIYGEIFP